MCPRLVLVHGSVTGGRMTWGAQRPLEERFELVVVERPGFPPGPPVERVDFEVDARLVADAALEGDHLVGHSYGGVICLLAAAAIGERLGSLTLIEPPATRVTAGIPEVDAFAADAERWWACGPRDDPEAFLRGFLSAVGSSWDPPAPLPPEIEQGARLLVDERGPWEAEIPLDAIAATSLPTLVVSGAHHEAFDAICDALVARLRAEPLVLPGFGHTPQRHPDFNARLADFVQRAEAVRR